MTLCCIYLFKLHINFHFINILPQSIKILVNTNTKRPNAGLISPCENNPCSSDEAGSCQVYQSSNGCVQCTQNSFQFGRNYPCVDCKDTFGEYCMHCANNDGCQQCDTQYGFYRVYGYDDENDLTFGYCQESVCSPNLQSISNCMNCNSNNGLCEQCLKGYFRMYNGASGQNSVVCLQCNDNDITGEGCMHCEDFYGCKQCNNNLNGNKKLKEKINSVNGLSYHQCVPGLQYFSTYIIHN